MSDRSWSPLQFSEGSGHTGCMVGLWLSPDAAATLALPGGEPATALHVTLAFLEQSADDLTDVLTAHLLACVDNLAAWQAPITAEVSGIGRFYADNDDDAPDGDDRQDVIYASIDAPGLTAFREQLVREIGWEGLRTSDEHGFDPHCTLAYVAPGSPWPNDAIPTIPLTFDAITVCVGDRQTEIPFRGFPADDGIIYADGMYYADARKVGSGGRFFTELQTYMEPPAWLPLLPTPGEYKHASYGTVDLSADVIAQLVASINDGVYQASIPIDVSHNKTDLDLNGALGWFGQARVNADGSADVFVDKWTARGEQAVRDEQFRYISPEWDPLYTNNKGEEIPNVVLGLALCTDPFFKDLAIDRAIVASARGTTPSMSLVFRDPSRFAASGAVFAPEVQRMDTTVVDPGTADTSPAAGTPPSYEQWKIVQVPGADTSMTAYGRFIIAWDKGSAATATATAATETVATDGTVTATDRPDLSLQFAAVSKRLETAETELKTERDKRRKQEFTDEVRGRSDANNIRWFGDIDKHVEVLESLPADKRQLYIDQQRETAKRMTALIGKELGSDGRGDGSGGAWEMIEAEALKFKAAEPSLTKEAAIAKVLRTNSDLAQKYSAEVRE